MSNIVFNPGGVSTLNSLPIVSPIDVYTSIDKSLPKRFGTDILGLPTYFTIVGIDETIVGSFKNESTSVATMSYTAQTGSEFGYAQSASITLEVSGGINLGVVSANTGVSVTGTLGFSQAFTKSVAHSVTAPVNPGKLGVVYEATLLVQYFFIVPMYGQNMATINGYYFFPRPSKDIICTGNYVLRES